MTTIEYVQKFRTAPESSVAKHPLAETFPPDSQLQWIFSKPSLDGFKDFVTFQKTLSTWPKQEQEEGIPDNDFAKFNAHITLNSDRQMWIRLFNDLGIQGIKSKVEEYWQQHISQIITAENTLHSLLLTKQTIYRIIDYSLENRAQGLTNLYRLGIDLTCSKIRE